MTIRTGRRTNTQTWKLIDTKVSDLCRFHQTQTEATKHFGHQILNKIQNPTRPLVPRSHLRTVIYKVTKQMVLLSWLHHRSMNEHLLYIILPTARCHYKQNDQIYGPKEETYEYVNEYQNVEGKRKIVLSC